MKINQILPTLEKYRYYLDKKPSTTQETVQETLQETFYRNFIKRS